MSSNNARRPSGGQVILALNRLFDLLKNNEKKKFSVEKSDGIRDFFVRQTDRQTISREPRDPTVRHHEIGGIIHVDDCCNVHATCHRRSKH